MHFKSSPLLNQTQINVNRDKGVIYNVSIVEEGPNKNGTFFNKKYLDELANGANEIKAGVKSRFGHPNMCNTTLGKYIGRYKNFQFDGKKVTADLHLDSVTKKTEVPGQGIKMFDYIMDMADANPDMFGNSIHIPTPAFEDEAVEIENVKYNSHIFNGIVASDVVDSPAATNGGLFNTGDLGVLMTQFLDENPQVFEVVQKDPSIIEDFFDRYSQYSKQFKNKIDMSFLDKLKKSFGTTEKFDIEETLADGTMVTIKTENETPQEGDQVVDEEGRPVPDGDHVTKDGSTITTEDGNITAIQEAEEEEEEGGDVEEPTPAEMMSAVNNLADAFNQFKTQYGKDIKENQDAIELVAKTFEKKFNNLAKTVKGKTPEEYKVDNSGKKKMSEGGYDADAVREEREKIKGKKNSN